MNNADPQLEHVDPAHPVAPDAYIRVLNCKSAKYWIKQPPIPAPTIPVILVRAIPL
ncbi:hypothetical protein [Acinetobacter baumannii]|uniref:hypothetical protein n=1 Tax=Acinetobacter baumannii TaxID=470 RepID=UPI00190B2953|nr:hypothetical protein [Acinetobacter baumannii]MBK3344430.1 hypothetical protein [Acinetobacter baumannii]MDG6197894.1 hypothetical protein [Acinetobacter baumannii]HEN9516595.1 hypothetical protein [Acinetobacter baumannii]